jgi:peptide/nickel transport system substrate-binding protein
MLGWKVPGVIVHKCPARLAKPVANSSDECAGWRSKFKTTPAREDLMNRWIRISGSLLIGVMVAGPESAAAENVLRWASATEALTFDPHGAYHTPTIAETQQVYEPLVGFNSSYAIEPSLATAWRLIDATTWEFDLRPDVRFHDGTPFTGEDVVFSLNRAVSGSSDYKDALPPITAVEAIDDLTVRVVTAAPDPILPSELSEIFVMSKH